MIALIATVQMIAAPMPQIAPARPEMTFACTGPSKPGEPIIIALPNGLNRSEVLVSDPGRILGRYTLTRYTWKIGADGRLSIVFSSNGDLHSPVFTVEQKESGSKNYGGHSHPFYWPKKLTEYSCQSTLGQQAANTIKLLRTPSQ